MNVDNNNNNNNNIQTRVSLDDLAESLFPDMKLIRLVQYFVHYRRNCLKLIGSEKDLKFVILIIYYFLFFLI